MVDPGFRRTACFAWELEHFTITRIWYWNYSRWQKIQAVKRLVLTYISL